MKTFPLFVAIVLFFSAAVVVGLGTKSPLFMLATTFFGCALVVLTVFLKDGQK